MIRERIRAAPEAARAVRRIVAAWRRLSGGRDASDAERKTLLACSGGADSVALVLALASASTHLAIGHVRHDMRDAASVDADRDAVKALAAELGLQFVEGEARVRSERGNVEASARRARYGELARMAGEGGCRLVATAHHADDQLETVIMRLVRGAGPRGMGGIAARRRMGGAPDVLIVRPMLGVTRMDAEAICRACGIEWRVDATNSDTSRLRAFVRARVAPVLRERSPGVSVRVARGAALLSDAARCVEARAHELSVDGKHEGGRAVFRRGVLGREPAIVLGELLRLLHGRLVEGKGDAVGVRALAAAARAIRSRSTDPRACDVGGLVVLVRAHEVEVRARGGAGSTRLLA